MSGMVAALSLLATASCAPTPPPQAVASAKPLTWADLLGRPRPVADKSFRYGPDPYQVVDLWRPAGPGPHPVVLMVHGGCWTTSIADRTLMNWAAADLRARGIAVWNIDYRGVDRPDGVPDGIFQDVVAAADLLRTHAAAERLDTRRMVAVGHSAGAHLALWLAGRARPAAAVVGRPLRISHVVSLGALPDLEQALDEKQGCGREPVARLTGAAASAGPRDRRALLADKSIPLMAPIGVPQTLVNGDADRIIPTHFATDYAAKMRAKGDRITMHILPNQGHVELIALGTPAWDAAVRAIEGALRR